jgi:hypothetical protein
MTAIKEPRLEERLVTSAQSLKTKALTITGQLRVEIPGRAPYDGVDMVEISHDSAMDVDVLGGIKKEGEDLIVRGGSLAATGYRSDPALRELYKQQEVRVVKDPHVVIYRGTETITLNQVQGVPVVRISDGRVSYQ